MRIFAHSRRIAESQDPAVTIELLNDYFALMFDAISSHGGTLNQMIGDGLMAVFGAPVPHPDSRERAVRAALEMLDNLAAFNEQQKGPWASPRFASESASLPE